MIGLDTNVLVRQLVQDDKAQSVLASKLIEESISVDKHGYITLMSLVEVVWVLKPCYSVNKSQLFEEGNGDFSDALIVTCSKDAGCSKTMTFDKKAKSVGMTLLSN